MSVLHASTLKKEFIKIASAAKAIGLDIKHGTAEAGDKIAGTAENVEQDAGRGLTAAGHEVKKNIDAALDATRKAGKSGPRVQR